MQKSFPRFLIISLYRPLLIITKYTAESTSQCGVVTYHYYLLRKITNIFLLIIQLTIAIPVKNTLFSGTRIK